MLEKGSYAVLLQVTAVDPPVRAEITFAAGDSLKLNVHTAPSGSVAGASGLNDFAPRQPGYRPGAAPATFLHTTVRRGSG